MEKCAILLGFFDKQFPFLQKIFKQTTLIDLKEYESRYVFALKVQQLYTALEDLLKQIAKAFENHVEDLSCYHKELLIRLNTEIPEIRPAVLSKESYLFLDKLRAFRHFIRHAYDCELEESELSILQKRLKKDFSLVLNDLVRFREYTASLLT